MADPITLDGESLTPGDVLAVARHGHPVTIADAARDRVQTARDRVLDILECGDPVYGLNTGIGDLVDTRIPREDIETLQTNLLRSHATGSGDPLDREAVRAMLVTRINAFLTGHSGVRERLVDTLAAMLNEGVHPVVRSRGSLGASGDLAPLAHLALVLIGEGEAVVEPPAGGDGDRRSGAAALQAIGREPLSLAPKEGIALINGTQLTVGLAALVVRDAERLLQAADTAGALTTEVTYSTTANCDPQLQAVRPHPGQARSAANVRALTAGSTVVESHRNCDRVQDAYAIRCLPQVHGAIRDAVAHLRDAVETELNSATDNPLVFDADAVDDRASGTADAAVLSGGNFHGEPLALRLDYLVSALTELGAISERRTDRLLNPHVQEDHLPAYLARNPGIESGLMIAQYTAAALLNECRGRHGPSTDNTPVSGGQEDHVSMSATSAFHARDTVADVERIVAVELLCGTEASRYLDDDLRLGEGTGTTRDLVREVVPPLEGDRPLHGDIDAVAALVHDAVLADALADLDVA
ncbi:MAG: histidine ammonia-lyase [Halobacteriaceae archaeon]